MTTYEEDIVDIYYNLLDYFTIKNIPFSQVEKKAGGKGRGEIDLLAIKIKDNKVIDAIHIEVSVSITSKFPFTSRTQPKIDESGKIIKKFFSNDSESKIKEIIGNTPFRRIVISSEFDNKSLNRIKERIPDFSGKVISIQRDDIGIKTKIEYNNKVLDIEIIPFKQMLNELKKLFKNKGMGKKNFQDPRYRGIQHSL